MTRYQALLASRWDDAFKLSTLLRKLNPIGEPKLPEEEYDREALTLTLRNAKHGSPLEQIDVAKYIVEVLGMEIDNISVVSYAVAQFFARREAGL